jgi:Chaperone of endosialidase
MNKPACNPIGFRLWLCFFLLTINSPLTTEGQGTAFTYQGRLNDTGNPANGNYDLTFTLFGVSSGGSVIVGPVTNSATPVSNGLFTVTLDFGAGVFTGPARFLEIGARTNGGGGFATISPRQDLTPSPYAIFAAGASNLAGVLPSGGLSGIYSGTVSFNNPSNQFTGNGAGLTNLNAVTLSGLGANRFWQTAGNAGTGVGSNFVGTSDNQPLELHVNGQRALRLEPTTNGPNVIGGTAANSVDAGNGAATIAGGDSNSIRASSGGSTIGGGLNNTVQPNSDYSFIGGGSGHIIGPNAVQGTIAGGYGNSILFNAPYSVVAGGLVNTINSNANIAFIGGGNINSIGSDAGGSVVVGGQYNAIGQLAGFSTIGGGYSNLVEFGAALSTLSGGYLNTLGSFAEYSTISGGSDNIVQSNSTYSSIGGGRQNIIGTNMQEAVIGGGAFNLIVAGNASVIAGGYGNTASGGASTVPGGLNNQALGNGSFAAGEYATALFNNSFVWSDGSTTAFHDTAPNQFCVLAMGGIGLGTSNTPDHGLSLGINTHLNDQVIYLRPGTDHNHGLAYCGPGVTNFALTTLPDGPVLWGYSGGMLGTVAPTFNGDVAHGHAVLSWTSTSVTVPGYPINLRALGDNNYGLAYCGLGVTNFGSTNLPDGPVLWGYSGGGLGSVGPAPRGAVNSGHFQLSWTTNSVTVFGTFNNMSDRNAKEGFKPVSPAQILEKVARLPISEWRYKADAATPHIGPVAQDFHSLFNIGTDDKHIAPIDEGGVALAAIQGLNQKLDERDSEVRQLRQQNEMLERRLADLEQAMQSVAEKR